MDRLAAVRLSGEQIDDAVLLSLAPKLRRQAGLHQLALVNTRVTAVGLRELHRCESLREIDLTGTKVGAAAIEALLKSLDRVERIVLTDTGLGIAARWKLKLSHRDVEITT